MNNPTGYKNEITELRNGSHKAFDVLYNAFADSLYGFALIHTKSVPVAEDIVQETFLKLWNIRESLSVEGSFKSMLFTIANHLIIDSFRKQINKTDFEEFIQFCSEEQLIDNSSTDQLYYEDFLAKLALVKEQLTLTQQTIFELSREEGFSIAEIAKLQKISEQTVKNQLTAALKIVRKELHKYHYLFSLFI